MTVVTTADTSQLVRTCSPTWLKLHGPLTVNELGLDYRIVIATVDDGRRWVLRIPRRAEVSAKVEPEARVLACSRIACRSRCRTGAWPTPSSLPIPCSKTRLRWSSQPGSSTPTGS
ncbi:macrolide 2'-phosphotransferase I [Escherichia coli]|nr:macrolide 2'-phosphotransferase I [Escherichia coli]